MDILIESTEKFEKDIGKLSELDKLKIIEKINYSASLLRTQRCEHHRGLRKLRLPSIPRDYDSSVYMLRVSQKLRVILAIDEDPIFEQTIFTLFRAVDHDNMETALEDIGLALYQEPYHRRKAVQVL